MHPSPYPLLACFPRIMRLQDELVTLRLECTNLYRKGHFSTLELAPTSTLSTTHLKGESLTKGLHTSSASWFRKPMTRTELVAISSSEDEGSLRFVYELLAWVEEMQVSAGPDLCLCSDWCGKLPWAFSSLYLLCWFVVFGDLRLLSGAGFSLLWSCCPVRIRGAFQSWKQICADAVTWSYVGGKLA